MGQHSSWRREFDVNEPCIDFEFPLGETYQTFAVANASGVTDKETCETAVIHLDPNGGSDVWLTSPVRFSTDKSVSEVSLEDATCGIEAHIRCR